MSETIPAWYTIVYMLQEKTPTILLVEDDDRLSNLMCRFLKDHDFNVSIEPRGDVAIKRISEEQPDLVILDISLPGASGFDVCRSVRSQFDGIILMLTARDDDLDQIVGLEMGAEDYVTKPIEPRVLLARVRALLRRNEPKRVVPSCELSFGVLSLQSASRDVVLEDQRVELTTMEFDLLWLLADNAGSVVSREWLFQELRGFEYDGMDRSIDIGISRLRKKLNDTSTPAQRIKTVRGKGYLFVANSWQST